MGPELPPPTPVRADRRRRLMLLTADYPPRPWSGIGRAVEAQARALAGRGHEVHVLVAGPGSATGKRGAPRRPDPAEPIVHRLSRRHFPVDAEAFDQVHLHSLALGALALELRRRFDLPLAYTVHGLVHRELPPGPRARRAARWQRRLLAASDAVVFLSRAERRAGCAYLPTVADRSRVIPNGLPEHRMLTAPPAAGDRRAGPVVFAGRFARSKGIDRLARLVPELVSRHRPGVVIAGGHGDDAGEALVADLVRRFTACRCPGWLTGRALGRLFDRAALVLIPSRYEPFGLVALEAMARGAPVLAADVGGLRDVVMPGCGSRRLADPTLGIWTAAALEMLGDSDAGRRGPAFVRRRFAIGRVAERLEREVYG